MNRLYKYTPGRDVDLLVAALWVRMDADGDIDRLFGEPTFGLGDFFTTLRPPREMLYAADETGIWLMVGFEPFMSGAYLSAYIRPDRRATVAAGSLFLRCLRAGIAAYTTLINVTWQEELIPIHEAMGYTFAGRAPGLFNGRDALIFVCTAESLERRKGWRKPSQPSGKSLKPQAAQVRQPALDFKVWVPQQRLPRPQGQQPTLQEQQQEQALPELVPLVLLALAQRVQPPLPHSS